MRRAAIAIACAAAGCAHVIEECPPVTGPIPSPVSVRVVDEAGAPLSGARVRLFGSDRNWCGLGRGLKHVGDGETDAAGDTTIALVRGQHAAVAIAWRGDRPRQETVVVADQANLVLGAPRAVHGRIADGSCDDRSVAVEVALVGPWLAMDARPARPIARAHADPDGTFTVDGLGPGHYRATAVACGQVVVADFTGRDATVTLR